MVTENVVHGICRDADGITALLSVLATPKTALKMQERALSTLAFLATSAANAKIVVNSNGVAALVPLLCARSDGVVTAAAGVLRCLLPLPSGQVGPCLSRCLFIFRLWTLSGGTQYQRTLAAQACSQYLFKVCIVD